MEIQAQLSIWPTIRLNRRLLILVFKCFLLSTCFLRSDQGSVSLEIQKKLATIYKIVDTKLGQDSISYKSWRFEQPNSLKIGILENQWEPTTYTVEVDRDGKGALVHVWADGLKFRSLLNKALFQSILNKEPGQQNPQLSREEAVRRGIEYLNHYQISISRGLKLKTAKFNEGINKGCWVIDWIRSIDGYSWDDSGWAEGVGVVFQEEKGLLSVGNNIYTPVPKTLNVVMTREEAIAKARKCAPLVEQTPFYRTCRLDGFVVNQTTSCELRISAPNYLLDPQRAVWMRTTPPKETRLCWVVRFTTVDSKANLRHVTFKFIPPDIILYLDAATGECVGANFT